MPQAHAPTPRTPCLTRRSAGALAAGAAATALTTACGATDSGTGAGSRPVPAVIQNNTDLLVWINDHSPEVQQWIDAELLPKFKQEQPKINVTIKWENWTGVAERLNAMFAAGSSPDVFTGGAEWAGSLALKKQSLDITSYVKQWGQSSDFTEAAMAATMMNGRNYGVPQTSAARSLIYRKDLFRAAGLPDRGPTSWEELLDWGRRLTKTEADKITVAGFGMTTNWSSWCAYMYQAGGDYTNQQGTKATVDNAAGLEWATFISDIYHKYKLVAPSGTPGGFDVGLQAMTEADPGVTVGLQRAGALDQLGIPDPIRRKQQKTSVFTNWMTISADTKVPDAAWKFVEFYTRAEHQDRFHTLRGTLPPRKSLQQKPANKDNVVYRRFSEIGEKYGKAFTPSCAWTDFRQQLIDFNKEIAEKNVPPRQALPELEKQMAQSLSLCVK
ncbi:MAG TPA: sugar ABC transporter substrate-binding protein [Chloroflexota bacterium]|nr:sugar ABC transporter substrate-binding protein [Chloroflexota bacterium]